MEEEPLDDSRRSGRKWIVLAVVAGAVSFLGCVVVGLAATLVVPNVMKRFFTAQETKAKYDILAIASAVEAYVLESDGRYPLTLEALVAPDEHGRTFLDRETVPLDPWGNEYLYEPPGGGSAKFRVFTYGEDGRPGGVGPASDIELSGIESGEY